MAESTESMDCERTERLISAMFDGTVPADRVEALADHLRQCPACQDVYRETLTLHEALISRATQDLDFICDQEGERFENQVLPNGLHSHRVPSGLVSMPEGWRERSREAREFGTRYVRVFVPDIHDRVIDKLSRGLAADWQDIVAVLASPPASFSGQVLSERATALLRRPTSTVFDENRFREAFIRLRRLAAERGVEMPDVEV